MSIALTPITLTTNTTRRSVTPQVMIDMVLPMDTRSSMSTLRTKARVTTSMKLHISMNKPITMVLINMSHRTDTVSILSCQRTSLVAESQ
jgi:hypothetical protein